MQQTAGLNEFEVKALLQRYGKNTFHINEGRRFFKLLFDIFREPMFLILMAACLLYFLLGEHAEGLMMAAAMCFVAAISFFQEVKSTKALDALKDLVAPRVRVIRGGREENIDQETLVPSDLILLEEGNRIPADARVLDAHDLSVNESILTGESFAVIKNSDEGKNLLWQGTVINSGSCTALILATGMQTSLGKIGRSINTFEESKTPLQLKLDQFVRWFALFGICAFLLIFLFNWMHGHDWAASILFGLTLAMSAIPEEIPVAFSSFMALGAYRMSKLGIITRQTQTIENLGAVNVICLDKTGTITENKMKLKSVFDYRLGQSGSEDNWTENMKFILYHAWLASEEHPFDAMEQAIEKAIEPTDHSSRPQMVSEYPLSGDPPMMTHVYDQEENFLVVAKGALERILRVCKLPKEEEQQILSKAQQLGAKGQRVLGICHAKHSKTKLPLEQDDYDWQFEGMISFYDPPKPSVKNLIRQFHEAGIETKLLTGDFPETAIAIANETGLTEEVGCVTGKEVMNMSAQELEKKVGTTSVFARMFPEAKLKVIEAVKRTGLIVAMTGDGVNDGPALKGADIGIAMGKRGTEVARQAADLILSDDDLSRLAEAVRQGRKIFSNLKKAIRYIISIHIPIILTASLPLLFGWKYPNIFTPVHIIFLELIMGPTCSVFYEREPAEAYVMKRPPRKKNGGLFTAGEFLVSLLQGAIIATGILLLYAWAIEKNYSLAQTRTIVFTTLILSNIFLTFENRSFVETLRKTIHYKNNLTLSVLFLSTGFLLLIHLLPLARSLFGLELISFFDLFLCLATALLSVLWFEIWKGVLSVVK
ncbi:MAG: cation-translocating P-type ATPase [Flavisolibacter sp.]